MQRFDVRMNGRAIYLGKKIFAAFLGTVFALMGFFVALIGLGNNIVFFVVGSILFALGAVLLYYAYHWQRMSSVQKLQDEQAMQNVEEKLVTVFSLGWFARYGTFGDMSTLIFTNKQMIAAQLVNSNDVDQSIKPHTKEFEEALANAAREKITSLNKNDLDALLHASGNTSVGREEIESIAYTKFITPTLIIYTRKGAPFNFKIIDKNDVESSLNALKQSFPNKVKW